MIQLATFILYVCAFFTTPKNTISTNVCLYPTINSSVVTDSTEFATLFIYRPKFEIFGPNFDVYITDSTMTGKLLLSQVKRNTYHELKIYKEGEYTLWTNPFYENLALKVNIQFGKAYYLRCGFTQGLAINKPKLKLVAQEKGEKEFKKKSN